MPTNMPPKPELLAPAGDRDALRAALAGGADAVYLAGARFGARAYARNFDEEGLRQARRATRQLGRRLYVTVNTLVFDEELVELDRTLDLLEDIAPDALIIQDLGVLARLHERGSLLPRHLSTQAAWDGAGGHEFLAGLGVSRVVLPRETSLAEAARVVARGPFEVEVFVHGAHCFSVSGRCFWSAALGERSGNRGTCAQPCRRRYGAEGASEALFSPKDLRLQERVQELRAAGVASLKIEGRMKDAGYVRVVVEAYRAALDGGRFEGVRDRRSAGEGFADGPPSAWRTGETVGELGEEIGVVGGRPDGAGRLPVRLERPVAAGDGIAWREGSGRKGGRVTWVSRPEAGRVKLRVRGATPPPRATLYRTGAHREGDPTRGYDPAIEREAVEIAFFGRAGEPLGAKVTSERGAQVFRSELTLAPARGEGLEVVLAQRFASLTDEVVLRLDTRSLGPGLFLPMSAVKALRREVRAFLAPKTDTDAAPVPDTATVSAAVSDSAPATVALRLWRATDLPALSHLRPTGGWIVPLDTDTSTLEGPVAFQVGPAQGEREAHALVEKLRSLPAGTEVLCASWEAFRIREELPHLRVRLDWGFNVGNGRARDRLTSYELACTSSVESARPLPGTTVALRVNPLVSITRFPPDPAALGRVVTNSHGDAFCQEALQPGLWGLFLLDRAPEALPAGGRVQIDVLLPRDEARRRWTLARVGALVG